MEIATPPLLKKVTPFFPSNPHLKVEVLSSPPPFLKIWLETQPPAAERRGAVPAMAQWWKKYLSKSYLLLNIIKHTCSWHDTRNLLYIHPEDTKKALFHNKKVIKGTPNLTSPSVHSLFTIVLIKQTSEKNKSSRAASGSRTQF